MPPKHNYEFDVFISYAKPDKAWVENSLLPRLKSRGLKVFIDFLDFELGQSELSEIQRGIRSSRKTLLILSPPYLKDNLSDFEKQLTRYMGIKDKESRCIPVIIAPCRLPDDIKYLVAVDLTSKDNHEQEDEWKKLLKNLTETAVDRNSPKPRKSSRSKAMPLPRMEKELRMNKSHWITAGFSMPANKFNFTAVYFENQLEIFRNLRIEVNSLADEVSRDKTRPRQAVFLKRAFEVLDQLQSSTQQVLAILEEDQDHELLLTAYKTTERLAENTLKARKFLMKSSVSGTLHPRNFDSAAAQLPAQLQACVISIEELGRHLQGIYKLAGQNVETEKK